MRLQLRIAGFAARHPATTILVIHDPEEAALRADELLVLEERPGVAVCPTADGFARPPGETVARLLGTENAAEGVATGERQIATGMGVVLDIAGPAPPLDRRVGWAVLSSSVRICGGGRYQTRIEGIVLLGNVCRVGLRLGDRDHEPSKPLGLDRPTALPP